VNEKQQGMKVIRQSGRRGREDDRECHRSIKNENDSGCDYGCLPSNVWYASSEPVHSIRSRATRVDNAPVKF
jgi:hypothetical protein